MKINCSHYNKCNAPLCPLMEESLKGIWYPDEEICKKVPWNQMQKTQHKIQKRARDRDTYYTYEMLNRNIVVKAGITGISPDSNTQRQQRIDWLKKHNVVSRTLTPEQLARLRGQK